MMLLVVLLQAGSIDRSLEAEHAHTHTHTHTHTHAGKKFDAATCQVARRLSHPSRRIGVGVGLHSPSVRAA